MPDTARQGVMDGRMKHGKLCVGRSRGFGLSRCRRPAEQWDSASELADAEGYMFGASDSVDMDNLEEEGCEPDAAEDDFLFGRKDGLEAGRPKTAFIRCSVRPAALKVTAIPHPAAQGTSSTGHDDRR